MDNRPILKPDYFKKYTPKVPSLEEVLIRERFEEILPLLKLTDFEKYCQGVKDGK